MPKPSEKVPLSEKPYEVLHRFNDWVHESQRCKDCRQAMQWLCIRHYQRVMLLIRELEEAIRR